MPDWPWLRGLRAGGALVAAAVGLVAGGAVASVASGAPVISEFLAVNTGGLRDEDGDSSDWIELYNPGPEAVSLEGWRLTDRVSSPARWTFPAVTLPAGEYLIVFASDKNRAAAGGELHTNFKLGSGAGGYLALFDASGAAVDVIDGYPAQRSNVSFGRARRLDGTPLVGEGSPVRVMIPSGGEDGGAWTGGAASEPFDDTAWNAGQNGIGFDLAAGSSAGLIGYWDFNDASQPAVVPDRSGHGRHGAVTSAVYTTAGRSGGAGDGAMDFARTGSRVNIPVGGGAMFAGAVASDEITISLWLYGHAAQGATAQSSIFWAGSQADGGGVRALNAHVPWTDRVIYFDTAGCCEPGVTRIQVADPDPAHWRGSWNHYVFVKRRGVKEIYRNGELIHAAANTEPLGVIRSFWIGTGSASYQGLIDDFAVWEIALDPGQIGALAAGASPLDLRRLAPLVKTDVSDAMHGVNASVWMRFPFTIEDEPAATQLALRMQYDDGFAAWLNGHPVARRNAAADAAWNAAALEKRPGGAALRVEEIDLSAFAGHLRPGANVLAIHGMNAAADDPDFLMKAGLHHGISVDERYFSVASPGRPNDGESFTGFVDALVIDPPRGHYDTPQTITLSCATPGASLVYTTDGSEPSLTNGIASASPLTVPVSTTTCLRATAFAGLLLPPPVETHTYLFVDDVASQTKPAFLGTAWPDGSPVDFAMDARVIQNAAPGYTLRESLLSLPALSLVLPPDDVFGLQGIYPNSTGRGDAWERAASAELLHPGGGGGFHVRCGLHIHGNISRQKEFTPKHSFRLRFRGDYGPATLDAALFPGAVTQFDQLVLRGGSTDTWPVVEWPPLDLDNRPGAADPDGVEEYRWLRNWASYVRDQWVRDSQIAMGQPSARGSYVHLFLNGWYWGLYNMCEHPDADFSARHFGGRKEEWDTIADFSELKTGTIDAWNELHARAAANTATEANYQRLLGNDAAGRRNPEWPVLLDETSLIDYMILHIFIGADDWPDHNWWAVRRHPQRIPGPLTGDEDTGFHFLAWDQEISNVNPTYRKSSWGAVYEQASAPGTPAAIYSRARLNPGFRRRFGDRIHRHLFHGGALSREVGEARWNARVAEIDRAMVAESARWGDYRRPSRPYRREVEWLAHLNWMATNYWPNIHDAALVRFRAASLYPSIEAPTFSRHGGALPRGESVAIIAPPTPAGQPTAVFYTIDGSDPADVGAPAYTGPLLLKPPVTLKARARRSPVGEWSALAEASFFPDLDSDGDGLPDSWEIEHGLDAFHAGDAAADGDGDGFTALAEYVLGTDPRDAANRFHVSIEEAAAGGFQITFSARPGRHYTVQVSGDLQTWTEAASVAPEETVREVTVPLPDGGGRFARLVVHWP